ncbi:MAG: hypothetical protein HUU38_05695 [Anaerolineales bacterium]|jgi:hypothetical protein|nr:hypothetical protein [Anaerolineales bacterium]
MSLKNVSLRRIAPFILMVLVLAACGAKPVTIADLPVYPNATALNPGDDPIADTLVENMAQDAQIRTSVGVGGSVEQKAFSLPADASWDALNKFFTDELTGNGWEAGMGGPGGNIAGDILNQVNADNDLFQTTMFSKGKQVLTIMRVADPVDPASLYLIISLSTN